MRDLTFLNGTAQMHTYQLHSATVLFFLLKDRRDVEIVAEVSGWLFEVRRLAEGIRKKSSSAQLIWSPLYCRKRRAQKVRGVQFVIISLHVLMFVSFYLAPLSVGKMRLWTETHAVGKRVNSVALLLSVCSGVLSCYCQSSGTCTFLLSDSVESIAALRLLIFPAESVDNFFQTCVCFVQVPFFSIY